MFTPGTKLYLLRNIDFTKDYKNTRYFSSITAQTSYFIAKVKPGCMFTNFTYQRKQNTVKVPTNIESLFDVSYLMFQNSNTGTKWFYAFITDLKYVNDEVTEIFFELDVMQTWLYDIELADSFIEREHVDSDTIGEHLIEENLSTGDYKVDSLTILSQISYLAICVMVSEVYSGGSWQPVLGGNISGIYSGLKIFAFNSTTTGVTALNVFLNNYTVLGKSDAVVSIFMIPYSLLPSFTDGTEITSTTPSSVSYSTSKQYTDIDGYSPRNNKLFTHPYNLLYVTNHNGSSAIYKYELSDVSTMNYTVKCNIAPSPTVVLKPSNYKGTSDNYDEALRIADYPLCSWNVDLFKNWLAQNAVSIPISIATSALSLGVGIATGNPIAVAGGVIGVASSIGGLVEKDIIPAQAKGSVSGSANTSIGIQTFAFYKKTIRNEYAKIIDDYFQMYGYKVNRVDVPDLNSRLKWNYIKTIDCNIFGNIPNNDLSKIRQNFDRGITFWHDDLIGYYNRVNNII